MDIIDPHALRDVFDRAAGLPLAERAALLDQACGDNADLRREVERLLTADARFGTVFETAASDSAESSQGPLTLTLAAGARLGPYLITAPLGAGGMGEVYRAHDTRLERPVAIKVLRRGLTADPTARHRFEREARAIAALSHAHICPLFDIGHQDGTDYLVMEYLDGDTLAARLARGKLPLDQALAYGSDIAHALAAAHQAGIVHRDLKPGNIMVTPAGIKLLDFGLAKRRPLAATDGAAVAQSQPLTHSGMILGTVQYMAPEQLEGREADERTDLFAFGVVLYEMVTGHKAFDGASNAALIGNILHAQPPSLSSYEALSPPALDEVVRVCLAKDPSRRWQSATDVVTRVAVARQFKRERPPSARRFWAVIAVAVLLTGAGVGMLLRDWRSHPRAATDGRPLQRKLTRVTFDSGLQTDPTFSPDGRLMAYASDRAGNSDIWVQPVGGEDAIQVTKSAAEDTQPSWSPDGTTIAFRSGRDGGGLYVVPALGGMERLLVNFGEHPTWSPDGIEVTFQTNQGSRGVRLYAVSLQGEPPHEVFPEFSASGRWVWISPHPDGRMSFLGAHYKLGYGFFTSSATGEVIASDMSRMPGPLTDMVHSAGQRFKWNKSGTALILETETNTGIQNIWRVQVDPVSLAWDSVERLTTGPGKDLNSALSPDGSRLLFSTQVGSDRLWRFQLDPAARRISDGHPVTEEGAWAVASDVTDDGATAVYDLMRPGAEALTAGDGFGVINVWLTHLDRGSAELLATNATHPVWSPDRRQIAYLKLRPSSIDPKTGEQQTALAVKVPGGSERLISPWSTTWMSACDWSANGNAVLACAGTRLLEWPISEPAATTASRIVLAVRDSTRDAGLREAKFSPDRRWMAFVFSDVAGSLVGVTSADGQADRQWIPVAPKSLWVDNPRWSRDGMRLYFLARQPGSSRNLWAVDFDPARGRPIGAPFQLTHFDSAAFTISPMLTPFPGMAVFSDRLFITMSTATGNIWMLDNVDR